DVLGDRRVRRACPLAVHDLVEDVGVADVGRLQASLPQATGPSGRRWPESSPKTGTRDSGLGKATANASLNRSHLLPLLRVPSPESRVPSPESRHFKASA